MLPSTPLLLVAIALPAPTPVLDAMRALRWEDAQRLVEAGAEVNERNGSSATPLTWSITGGRSALVAALLVAGPLPARGSRRWMLLVVAAFLALAPFGRAALLLRPLF